MHGAIQNRLEDLLRPERSSAGTAELNHLSGCEECSSELAEMRSQCAMLRSLKGPADVEVSASFYAGVMRLVEERRGVSIWSNLIRSPFSTRLAYVSLTAALLVGSYVVTQEERDGHLGAGAVLARNVHYDAPVFGDQVHQRNAVLTNFASH